MENIDFGKGCIDIGDIPENGSICYFEIQLAPDGRFWLNVNGKSFVRFKPLLPSQKAEMILSNNQEIKR